MKTFALAIAVCGLLGPAQPVLAQDNAAFAPIHQFADGMNAGDMKKAAAAYTPSATIIDEFGVHHWTSFSSWIHDAGAYFKAGGVTGLQIGLSKPSFQSVDARYAYAVVPTVLSFSEKGKPTKEKGLFTFSMAKTPAGWRLTGWAWSTL
jgi:hypothetical protein